MALGQDVVRSVSRRFVGDASWPALVLNQHYHIHERLPDLWCHEYSWHRVLISDPPQVHTYLAEYPLTLSHSLVRSRLLPTLHG